MKQQKHLHEIKFRLWVFQNSEKFLGIGRIELLELIHETGSISGAAKKMKMSYRQAWQMVTDMNRQAVKPFVEKKLGGKSGGGAQVTPAGLSAISTFRKVEKKVAGYVHKEFRKIKF
jgi:molybdate transport system regulatory protein